MKIMFLLLILLQYYLHSATMLECYWNKANKYKYFASKTPYEVIRGDLRDSINKFEGCEPIIVWTLMRHGGRNPGGHFARAMKHALTLKDHILLSYDKGNSSLCAQDIENLRNWEINEHVLRNPYALTKQGYSEMAGVGKRMKEAIPELLSHLKDGEYLIRPAFGSRIEDSVNGFIAGLQTPGLTLERNDEDKDYDIIAPYTTCGKYQRDVKNNSNIYLEAINYENSKEFIKTKETVEKRMGLNFTLTNTEIKSLYDLCRFTWDEIENKPSPWCALFLEKDLKVLEYIDDLRHYYRNGYGTSLNSLFGRLPLSDMLTKLKEAKENKKRKLVLYVSHATMMDMTLTALGLFKDERPLTGAYRDAERKWRATFMSTFGVNLIAILNRCGSNDYNVALYWNEKPLKTLGKEGVFSWQEFEEKLSPFLNTTVDFCEFRSTPY